ncbi:uncharacterized protein LY89DRAFT_740379 [Mollisia scopiformis]|uniref:Uncharacterized protein n=1 Tax=Mollisia scopiformis TaxID=149040 RepID=A0A132BDA9_MOLSC|nr:uncharacterized protein LY89DRAFT_740379 [Mollisia scopiformis]KUJ09969.1 hypothetical protein LY89DRAFT_740379 [Mollisia scopiformis]
MRHSLALCLCSCAITHGYYLDDSCTPYADLLAAGMKGAFDFANAASGLLSTPSTSTNVLQAQRDLTTFLFPTTMKNPTDRMTVSERFSSVLAFGATTGTLEGTLDPILSVNLYLLLPPDKIIFFCDEGERFEFDVRCNGVADKGWNCDRLMETTFQDADVPGFLNCFDNDSEEEMDDPNLPNAFTLQIEQQDRPTPIQICPWYLQKLQSARFKTLEDLGTSGAMALSENDFNRLLNSLSQSSTRTAMDSLELMDMVLLHELTHAISKPTGDFDDAGWQSAVAKNPKCIDNAENYAFFGLAARMISPIVPGAKPMRPMIGGNIQIIPADSTSKRAAVVYDNSLALKLAGTASISGESAISKSSSSLYYNTLSTFSTLPSSRSQIYSSNLLSSTSSLSSSMSNGGPALSSSSSSVVGTSYMSSQSLSLSAIATYTTNSGNATFTITSSPFISSHASSIVSVNATNTNASLTGTFSARSSIFGLSQTTSILSVATSSHGNTSLMTLSSGPSTSIQSASATNATTPETHTSQTGWNTFTSSKSDRMSYTSVETSTSTSSVQALSSLSDASNTTSSMSVSLPGIGNLPFPTSTPSSLTDTTTGAFTFSGSWTDVESTLTPQSFVFFRVPTGTITSAPAETSEVTLLGDLFLALQANRKWLTDSTLKSKFLDSVQKTKDETTALLNDLSVKPADIPDCHDTKRKRHLRLSERQLRAMLRQRSIIGSIGNIVKGAVHDVGTLISCAGDVVQSLHDAVNIDTPDLGEIEDLTDTLAEIGQDLQYEGDDDENTSTSKEEQSSATTSSSASLSTSSFSSSSRSCSTQFSSACSLSYSAFVPAGATTITTATYTLSCSTVTGCSASAIGSATTVTASSVFPTASLIGDSFGNMSWFDQQQAILAAVIADTTDVRVTWSPSETTTSSILISNSTSSGYNTVSILPIISTKSGNQTYSGSFSSSTPGQSSVFVISTQSVVPANESTSIIVSSSQVPTTLPVTSVTPTSSSTATFSSQASVTSPITSITPTSQDSNPFPFTTTLGNGQVEACRTSTLEVYAGYSAMYCAGSVTTLSPATTSSIPSATPTCDVHASEQVIFTTYELSEVDVDVSIIDGGGNKLFENSYSPLWGVITTVPSSATKLPYNITFSFLIPTGSNWENSTVSLTAGSEVWNSESALDIGGETPRLPYCHVEAWKTSPKGNRTFDCYWAC